MKCIKILDMILEGFANEFFFYSSENGKFWGYVVKISVAKIKIDVAEQLFGGFSCRCLKTSAFWTHQQQLCDFNDFF